ncbi:hypothetical protein [Dokdonia sp.]|uniref:hypothetical protein n=1 Tax=Dokdonia sp. TaxID=2024995 RepID=UPI00326536A7
MRYKGAEIQIWDNILTEYFERYPERVSKTPFMITSLWRGYFSEFEISKNNELHIVSLKRYIGVDKKTSDFFIPESVLDKAFPSTKKCEFFSGFLRIDDAHTGVENAIFIVLEFDQGTLIKEHHLSVTEFQKLYEKERVYNSSYT